MIKILRLSAVLAALILLATISLAAADDSSGDSTPHPTGIDGRNIKKLEWYAPPGVVPGKYAEYIKAHPITSPNFKNAGASQDKLDTDFSILVDAALYPYILTALNQYITDIEAEGYKVEVSTVSGGTPQDIKNWVTGRYNEGSEGFIFIGDVTAAWAEVSGDQFPCDLFYMDLDGNWEDNNSDGVYEVHTAGIGDMAPEVYIGRLYAHTLSYDTEANMVNEYFTKAHAYRQYELTEPWRGMEYVEEDWWDMAVNLDLVYADSVVSHDYGYYTTGADYLDKLDEGRHFVTVCAHSYSGGHHFGTRPTESAAYAHVYVYSPTTRAAKLLLGSDDGIKVWLNGAPVYTNDRYGGWTEDAYEAVVFLQEGWNRLLCKVSQDGGDFRFSARFVDPSYNTFSDFKYQVNDPSSYPKEAEFIRSWLLNGFHEDIADNFWSYLTTNYLGTTESTINPTEGTTMGGHFWTTVNSESPYIDMSAYDQHDYGACYAYARVYSETPQNCQLWVGYDDGARVWLNGSEVLYANVYGGYEPDMSKINVSLNAGENRLLVKVSQWMGTHGFSARFCQADGSPVSGLTYDPEAVPISHVGTWLVNGPYLNPDINTRLATDYLGDEGGVAPYENAAASMGTWQRCTGSGRPFDLAACFDGDGDWVYSSTIQERDPPVLFYNLFSCGPGQFTDDNYLAGSYIFNTSTGLITIASSKSGSMLNFQDFTGPLAQDNETVGQAMLAWFQAQAPYELWEQEWSYGLVLNGDPTLKLLFCNDSDGDGYGDPDFAANTCTNDNCPDDYNPDQTDSNGNGIGDACEANCCLAHGIPGDANSDGLVNLLDILFAISYVYDDPYGDPPNPDGCDALLDANGDHAVNLIDILRLIACIYDTPPGETPVCPM